jgi:hypothetical protein
MSEMECSRREDGTADETTGSAVTGTQRRAGFFAAVARRASPAKAN